VYFSYPIPYVVKINFLKHNFVSPEHKGCTTCGLWSSRNDFIASIPVCSQVTERGQLRSTPLAQLCI